MTDPQTLDQLDARAAAAAADLRARAERRPVPTFDPERAPAGRPADAPVGPRSRRPLLAVAAVLVLLVGTVAWWAARPGDDDAGPVTSTTDEPRGFVATDPPDGWRLAGAGEGASAPSGVEWPPLVVYGPAADDPRLGLVVLEDADPESMGEDAEPIDVDGRTGLAFDHQGLGRTVVGVFDGSRLVLAVSGSLDREALTALVARAEVQGREAAVPAEALPDGWRRLGADPAGVMAANPVSAGRGSIGSAAYTAYTAGTAGTDDERYVLVSSTEGDDVLLHAPEVMLDQVEDVAVHGRPAIVGTVAQPTGESGETVTVAFVSWIERPGELVRLSGLGLDPDEAVAFAESLAPVEGAEWRRLVEDAGLGRLDPAAEGREVGEGTFADGTRWVLRAEAEDGTTVSPELSVALTPSPSSSTGTHSGSSGDVGGLDSYLVQQVGDRAFAAGFLGPDVDRVELARADGTVAGTATIVEGAGRRGWVAELVDDPVTVTARAADGTPLGAVTIRLLDGGTSFEEEGELLTPTTTG